MKAKAQMKIFVFETWLTLQDLMSFNIPLNSEYLYWE